MRTINRIIWHCSATPAGRPVTLETIRRWHVEGNGWSDIGYHYVVELDGTVRAGRPVAEVGAHVRGHNADSVGICYVGGMDAANAAPKDTRTPTQREALHDLTHALLERFPGATVHGHNEYAAKACPSFDARADWAAHLEERRRADLAAAAARRAAAAAAAAGIVPGPHSGSTPAFPRNPFARLAGPACWLPDEEFR